MFFTVLEIGLYIPRHEMFVGSIVCDRYFFLSGRCKVNPPFNPSLKSGCELLASM